MSVLADRQRSSRQLWAAPGGTHDRIVRLARNLLPVAIVLLLVVLAAAPLTNAHDISFVLAKDRVEVAHERLRVSSAQYRGQDGKGEPFTIDARSAVQASSRDPVVKLAGLTAGLALADGPARLVAGRGRYDMTNSRVFADGPVVVTAPRDFRLDTADVALDLDNRALTSTGPARGSLDIGDFRGDRMTGALQTRTVVIEGHAHLHIVQGRGRTR